MYDLKRDFNNQIILACDDQGNFQEYIPRSVGHTGNGRRHLAITVLIFNSKGEVLIQERKHKVFDKVWDFTGSTHPVHKSDGSDESFEECASRCLKYEYYINDKIELKNLGGFNYFENYKELCENEHCMMMIGEYNGQVNLNKDAGYSYKWMDKKEFIKDVEQNPKNYAPWVIEGVKILKFAKF